MGVTGLWPIVQPCARPIKLETLNRKRLAVDASIWIYQFLKAVRDKEGNALRNSHVVGFFRRICKLLFFGIKPVFVFDGGAPVLKRQTVQGRKRRREGRRDDAVRTAGKLLAVQMQRRLEEDEEKRKRLVEVRGREVEPEPEEEIPDLDNLVYVDELGMSAQERQQARKFTKKDAYHLPDLNGGIENMGQPNDPRIMSAEELEEYARQFDNGEDINLYDFSKIDFNGEFFMSLPAVDRYNILNAARLRSRLRMGLSKEQLEEMFPDRMAFSKFQIERVRERNELTQRLMNLNGMNNKDAMWGVTGGGRIAGERDREYVLVKNDGVEGGWALGVVTTDKTLGERNKPIDVDAISRNLKRPEGEEWEDEDDFEDVPIEGLNRLPKAKPARNSDYGNSQVTGIAEKRKQLYASQQERAPSEEINSLFVANDDSEDWTDTQAPALELEATVSDEEERDLNLAIALSLQSQYQQSDSEEETNEFEDIPMPSYEQKAVETPKPIANSNGRMVAHIVNNRANAAVPKRRAASVSSDDSDMDLQALMAASRKQHSALKKAQATPASANIKNPFDGPLPFEKLNFTTSLFGSRKGKDRQEPIVEEAEEDKFAGGFQHDDDDDAPKPLPPWMVKTGDIRSDVKEQRARDFEINAEDRARALEEERIFQRNHGVIEVDSSDDGSDVEMVATRPLESKAIDLTDDSIPPSQAEPEKVGLISGVDLAEKIRASPPRSNLSQNAQSIEGLEIGSNLRLVVEQPIVEDKSESSAEEYIEWSESDLRGAPTKLTSSHVTSPSGIKLLATSATRKPSFLTLEESTIAGSAANNREETAKSSQSRSPSPIFEDVEMPDIPAYTEDQEPRPPSEGVDQYDAQQFDIVSDVDFDEFSDPGDEELLAQLASEAEEHARFASTLNNKSAQENQEAYEWELKALRTQQKKDRRDADEVSHIMITECQALLRHFGLPYITAPMEAEAQCAELVHLGLVDGIVTDDSDIFLFGGTRVYKNMFNSNKFVECYLNTDLEKELSLSRHQLISIAHLLGSDYTEGLPGIGPVTALEILSEFPSANGLEDFRSWWSDVQQNNRIKETDAGSTFRKKFRRAQGTKLFLPPGFPSPAVTEAYLKPDVDSTAEPFQWGVPDLDSLRVFLMSTIGWTQERTDEVLVPVIKDMNRRAAEGTQSNITRYFEGTVGAGARPVGEQRSPGRGLPKESVRMREAVKKLKAKKGLTGTFAEEAAEWARKNELSEGAQVVKRAEREREKAAMRNRKTTANSRRRKRGVGETDVDDEEVTVEDDGVTVDNTVPEVEAEVEDRGQDHDDDDDSRDEYINTAKRKGKGKAKGSAASTRKKPRL